MLRRYVRLSCAFNVGQMRYSWSSRVAFVASVVLMSVCSAHCHRALIDEHSQPWIGHNHGRQLAAFQVEALGGPVSENCSAAPWRVGRFVYSIYV